MLRRAKRRIMENQMYFLARQRQVWCGMKGELHLDLQ